MKEVFYQILEASFYGSIVILAVLALRLALRKAPRSLVCLLWLLVGLRLVLPFEVESPLSLQPHVGPIVQNQQVTLPEFTPTPAIPQETAALPSSDNAETESPGTVVIQKDPVINGEVTVMDYGVVAAGIWLAGLLAMGIGSVISYWKLKNRVREACLMEDNCWECGKTETAFVLGFFPPKIYLPVRLSGEVRAFIVAHEKSHISRGDHWFKLLGYMVLSIHWFNPLVWIAYHLLCRDLEMACDERVVKAMDLGQRKAYSNALLSCAGKHRSISACPVAFGETSVKQRILSVLRYKKPGFWISLLAAAALLFVVVCLLTNPGSGEPDLSFLNYENAISLVAEQEEVMTIYYADSSICPGYVSGADLAAYLDNANWSERWWEPGDTSSPGSIEFLIGDDYRITVFDRGFARVKYGEEIRYYRIGRNDYDAAVQLLRQEPGMETEPLSEEALSRVQNALEEFQTREDYHISVHLSSHTDNYSESQFYQSGDDWLSTSKVNGTVDQVSYLKKDGAYYYRRYDGLANSWNGGFTMEDDTAQMHWLRTFDWRNADIRAVRQGTQGEIETLPYAEGPFETVTCILTGPFEVYRKTAYGGILTLTFDGSGNLVAAELIASYSEALLQENEITEEHILSAGGEFTQVSTQVLPATREEILSAIDEAYSQVSQEEREKSIGAMYLAQCKAALETVQSLEYYHMRVSYEFYQGYHKDAQHTADYWFDGENLLRTTDTNGMTHMTLLHNGNVYQSRTYEEPQWDRVREGNGKTEDVASWVMYYIWNDGIVKYRNAVAAEDQVTVFLEVEQPATIEGMYAESYEILFTFDGQDNLRSVGLGTRNPEGASMVQYIEWIASDYEEIQREIQNYIYAIQYAG